MPAELFFRWMAYSELEPWGQPWEDLRFGSVVAAVHNQWAKRGAKLMSARDGALQTTATRPRQQTVEEIHAGVMAWAWGCRARAGVA